MTLGRKGIIPTNCMTAGHLSHFHVWISQHKMSLKKKKYFEGFINSSKDFSSFDSHIIPIWSTYFVINCKSLTHLWLRTSLITFLIHFIKSYIFARLAIDLHDTALHRQHETIRENAPSSRWSHLRGCVYWTITVSWGGATEEYLSGTNSLSSSPACLGIMRISPLHDLVATRMWIIHTQIMRSLKILFFMAQLENGSALWLSHPYYPRERCSWTWPKGQLTGQQPGKRSRNQSWIGHSINYQTASSLR